jgi:hypothetical protein
MEVMSNTRKLIAAGLLVAAVALCSVVVVACTDDSQDCPRATLRIQVQLNLTASLADTISVISYAPPFTQTFSRTPDGVYGELMTIDVKFPEGYPADKLLTLLLRASAQGQTIGENIEQIHLLPGCTFAGASISAHTIDASPGDGAATD